MLGQLYQDVKVWNHAFTWVSSVSRLVYTVQQGRGLPPKAKKEQTKNSFQLMIKFSIND